MKNFEENTIKKIKNLHFQDMVYNQMVVIGEGE